MRLAKKTLSLILCTVLLSLSVIPSVASTESNDDNYNQLVAMGYSEDFLNSITEEMMEQIILNIGSSEADVSSSGDGRIYNDLVSMGFSKDFLDCISLEMMNKIIAIVDGSEIYKITYNNDSRPINYENDDIVVKSVDVVLKDKSTDEITGKCVCVYWTWQNGNPIAKQRDYLEIKWHNNDDFIYDGKSFYAEDYQIKNDKINVSSSYTAPATISNTANISSGVIGTWTDLKCFGGQNGGCVVLNMVPSNPIKDIDETKNIIELEYNHYYKSTVIIVVVLSVAVVGFVAVICINKNKKKKNTVTE